LSNDRKISVSRINAESILLILRNTIKKAEKQIHDIKCGIKLFEGIIEELKEELDDE